VSASEARRAVRTGVAVRRLAGTPVRGGGFPAASDEAHFVAAGRRRSGGGRPGRGAGMPRSVVRHLRLRDAGSASPDCMSTRHRSEHGPPGFLRDSLVAGPRAGHELDVVLAGAGLISSFVHDRLAASNFLLVRMLDGKIPPFPREKFGFGRS